MSQSRLLSRVQVAAGCISATYHFVIVVGKHHIDHVKKNCPRRGSVRVRTPPRGRRSVYPGPLVMHVDIVMKRGECDHVISRRFIVCAAVGVRRALLRRRLHDGESPAVQDWPQPAGHHRPGTVHRLQLHRATDGAQNCRLDPLPSAVATTTIQAPCDFEFLLLSGMPSPKTSYPSLSSHPIIRLSFLLADYVVWRSFKCRAPATSK